MSFVDLLGYAASITVLATFCMRTMIPLRIAALGSNVLFICYGYLDHLPPVLLLHLVLLPVNVIRLVQFRRLVHEMRDAHSSELSLKSLLPYMKRRQFSAGEVLVRKGEKADRLYYLSEGEVEVFEFKKRLGPGSVIGEIGIFAPNQVRTATVVCSTNCKLLELTEQKARELYFEDRSFSFAVLQLIIQRLTENNERILTLNSDLQPDSAG
jgi:CRP/FNR family cyclic AMP-dependent transcriptional regulator